MSPPVTESSAERRGAIPDTRNTASRCAAARARRRRPIGSDLLSDAPEREGPATDGRTYFRVRLDTEPSPEWMRAYRAGLLGSDARRIATPS